MVLLVIKSGELTKGLKFRLKVEVVPLPRVRTPFPAAATVPAAVVAPAAAVVAVAAVVAPLLAAAVVALPGAVVEVVSPQAANSVKTTIKRVRNDTVLFSIYSSSEILIIPGFQL